MQDFRESYTRRMISGFKLECSLKFQDRLGQAIVRCQLLAGFDLC